MYKFKATKNIGYSNGCMYVHRVVAQKLLSTPLLTKHHVHHKDGIKENNSIDNLMVFQSNADHARFHKGLYASLYCDSNGLWICEKSYTNRVCPNCNNTFNIASYKKNTFCSVLCRNNYRDKKGHFCVYLDENGVYLIRNGKRVYRNNLFILLCTHSFITVGIMYGVSDNAIRKWCKRLNIPCKSKYYKNRGK